MTRGIHAHIEDLLLYALEKKLILPEDTVYFRNRLLDRMHLASPDESATGIRRPLEEILSDLCDDAIQTGLIPDRGITGRDLFDTELMGMLTPRPSEVIRSFWERYAESPRKATDYYYRMSCDSDYIRTYRVKKDKKWTYSGKYGVLDITINLSKPEKDPKAIAAARTQKQSGYPKCALCRENEGYAGSMTQAARQSHRLIPLTVDGGEWFLQYSPYVYYNEHCILLSSKHEPMRISRETFRRQMDFVTQFPHYMLGSNADLPIVGGSILTHDHMQGGCYTFPMERAAVIREISFSDFPGVRAGLLDWPMSVIRLTSPDPEAIVALSDRILTSWRSYSDPDAGIFAETEGEPHNTVTPIARRRGSDYEMDLVLRNNRTTEEYPLGIFHPHAEKHHIKKENIGLIEVMGLAVLPARLECELKLLAEALLTGSDIAADPRIASHAAWAEELKNRHTFTPENVDALLEEEVGRVFEGVLEDAGVYSATEEGREAFLRFVHSMTT